MTDESPPPAPEKPDHPLKDHGVEYYDGTNDLDEGGSPPQGPPPTGPHTPEVPGP